MSNVCRYATFLMTLCAYITTIGCSSKQPINQGMQVKEWTIKSGFDNTFIKNAINTKDEPLIQSFVELYHVNSHNPEFNTLVFYKVMLDSKHQFRYFLFDIKHTRHDIVVFKVNNENQLVDNYLISTGFH